MIAASFRTFAIIEEDNRRTIAAFSEVLMGPLHVSINSKQGKIFANVAPSVLKMCVPSFSLAPTGRTQYYHNTELWSEKLLGACFILNAGFESLVEWRPRQSSFLGVPDGPG